MVAGDGTPSRFVNSIMFMYILGGTFAQISNVYIPYLPRYGGVMICIRLPCVHFSSSAETILPPTSRNRGTPVAVESLVRIKSASPWTVYKCLLSP